mgnify:FL=1
MTERESAERAASMILRARDCVRRYKNHTREHGRIFMILGGLREYENRTGHPVTITEIARHSGLAVPNVGRLLKPLEEAGLLRREKQGRTVHVAITPQGDALLAEQREDFLRDVTASLSALDERERDIFLACGEKLLARLEEHLKNQSAGDIGC